MNSMPWSRVSLPSGYAQFQQMADEACARVEPFAARADDSSELDGDVRAALQASGLARLTVPAEFGGVNPTVDPLAICVVRERLMATSSHLDSLFALQGIGSYAISTHGSAEQRGEWLPRVASLDTLAALALTEPVAGSDLRSIRTEVTARGDSLLLNGEKSFISNAGVAGFYTTLVKEQDGLSMFLVPADRPGLSTAPAPELIAPHVLGSVQFNDVELRESDRLGAPGSGLDAVLGTLAIFRVSVAGASVGLAAAALEEAVRHARSREQFGRPLARHGPVAQLLADSAVEIEMARLLAYNAASCASLATLEYSSMAKLGASEMASRVVDRCVQAMGRWGLVRGSKIERLYRQARPMRIYEGASEILRLGISRHLCNEIA